MTFFAKVTTVAAAAAGFFAAAGASAHEIATPHAHVGETAVIAGPVLLVAIAGLIGLAVAIQRRAKPRAVKVRAKR